MLSPTVKGKVYQVEVVVPDSSTEGNVTQVEIVGGGQVQSMFEPQESLLGLIVQYVGETTDDYTNGYFYQVVESEDNPGTYVWVSKSVQSGGGGGSSNYNDLSNKPKINGVTLSDNKTSVDLGIKNVITLTGESGTLTAEQIAQVQDDTAVLEIVCDGEVFRLSNKDSTLTYRTFINTNCEASETVSFKVIYVQLNQEAVNYGAWTLEEVSAGGGSEPTVETVTGNTPTIANVQGNHIYNCTGTLTSLTLTAVETTYAEATIYMTTGASITVNVPASVKTIGYTEFSPNTSYVISFANNTMVIGEINA